MCKCLKFIPVFMLFLISFLSAQDIRDASTLDDLKGHKIPQALLGEISIDFVNASFEQALADISEKGNIKLSYNRENIPLNQKISVKRKNVYVVEALLAILDQTSTALSITQNGSIIIVPNKNAKESVENGEIHGFVQDASTGGMLPGANVWLDGTAIGAATSGKGSFLILNIPPGKYNLKANYIGYDDFEQEVVVKSGEKVKILVSMKYSGAGESETIVIQAQASGQMQAINQQLSSAELKNVVSKDRIQQLPSQNAAESVGRLPGVSLMRAGGEGNRVVIRGLEPKYSKIMVDGVSMSPTGNDDRSVSMGSISSYSLEGIEVIKSPTANMDGDQVGGSVNFVMKTAPENFRYEVVAQGGYNELRSEFSDYMFVANVSDRFMDSKLGIFAQALADGKNMGSNSMSAGYSLLSQDTDKMNPLSIYSVSLNNTFRYRKRLGGTLTFDYKLPDGKIYFKNYLTNAHTEYNIYTEKFKQQGHEFIISDKSNDELIYTNVLNYTQDFSNLNIAAKLAHSYSGTNVPNNMDFGFLFAHDMNTFDPSTPPGDVPSYARNEYEKFYWDDFEDMESFTEGRQIMGQLDFTYSFSVNNQVNGKFKFGGKYRYDTRSYDLNGYTGNPTLPSGIEFRNEVIDQVPALGDANPEKFYYPFFYDNDFSHGDFLKGNYTMGPVADINILHDVLNVMNSYYYENYADKTGTPEAYHPMAKSSVLYDYDGVEKLNAGYLMLDLNITDHIRFIPGVRYEAKSTTYNGVWGRSGPKSEFEYTAHDTTSQRDNGFWLPMIHLRYDPVDWLQVRMAFTKTLARPNYKYILPNTDYGVSGITMHNSDLRPEVAENYDLYFAFSQNYIGLFTVGGFWKNIKDKIFDQGKRVLLNPAEYGLGDEFRGQSFNIEDNNSCTSVVKGFELDWQTNFWYLPSILKGIVLNVNYTKIFSETKYPKTEVVRTYPDGPFGPPKDENIDQSYWERLLNQPEDIMNLSLGFDYKGFSGRLSMNYQSDIFLNADFWPEKRRLSDGYLRWDLALNQKLPWQGLQVFANIVNLNNAIESSRLYYHDYLRSMNYYGRAFYVGLRWKMD